MTHLIPEVGGCLGCWLLLREVLRMGVLVWPAVIGVTLELRARIALIHTLNSKMFNLDDTVFIRYCDYLGTSAK